MNSESRLGFLNEPLSFVFEGVRLECLPDYAERKLAFEKQCNNDGYFYPPLIALYTNQSNGGKRRKLPHTTRPAKVFPLIPSHILKVDLPIQPIQPYSDSAFLLQALAFISGSRLQFEPFNVDGRVPSKSSFGAWVSSDIQANFIESSYVWWKNLSSANQIRAINLFYVYNRSTSCEWDWDLFSQQYMVFDGIYRLHVELSGIMNKDVSHRKRFAILASAYDIKPNPDLVTTIYNARNDLFHEALWAGAMMGYSPTATDSTQYPHHLRRLNARMLCAIVGYKNSFTQSVWWAMGRFSFDRVQ